MLSFNSGENSPQRVAPAAVPDPGAYVYNPHNFTSEQVRRIIDNVIEIIYSTGDKTVNKCRDDAGNIYTVKIVSGGSDIRARFKKATEAHIMIQEAGFDFISPIIYAKSYDKSDSTTMINGVSGNNILIAKYIEGRSLEKIPSDSLDYKTVLSIQDQLIHILSEISARGFVHRDIRGENIVVTPTNKVYLIDFETLCDVTRTHFSDPHSCTVVWWGSSAEAGEGRTVGTVKYTRAKARVRPYTYVPADDKYALGMLIESHLRRISKSSKGVFDLIGSNMRLKHQGGGRRTMKRSTKRKTRRHRY